jgi:general transcription factor IIIA
MKTEVFIHQNQRVSYADAYSDVNGCPPVSAESICETCTNLLESAYVFRQLCQVTNQPIYNVCRCCLQEKLNSNDEFWDMRNTVFEHKNTTVTLFEGYSDVNNSLDDSANITISEAIICDNCAVQLNSAYAFRRMCQKTAEILQQTSERAYNKEIEQECSRLYSAHWSSHNTKKKKRNADKQRAGIKIKTDQNQGLSLGGFHKHKTTIHLNKLFKCKVCDKMYKNPTCLSAHTNAKHSNKTFQCEKCSKVYHRKDYFIMHYRSKHLNIVFACQDCDKVFTSKTGLTYHKDSIHIKILHQCEKCPKTFSDNRGLRVHVENIHEKKKYSCQDCEKVYKSHSALSVHKNIIHLKKLLKCKNCEKTFNYLAARNHHNRQEHLKLTFECQKCKKKLTSKQALAVHMQKIHPNDSLAC